MTLSRIKTIASWVLVVLLTLGFLGAAYGKFSSDVWVRQFDRWGYAPWFANLIGVLEFAGAIGLLIPRLTRASILGLTCIMIGAIYTHLTNSESGEAISPLIFLSLLWAVWFLRRGIKPKPTEAG